ncbi:Flp pilus assembly protein CpaB [Erysipelotrichaceae bacterium OH741_COT-311]|nr:Flp pilus assembly protein CpaB [Erysipelotrichaceae bacterium OH741_COT-311]
MKKIRIIALVSAVCAIVFLSWYLINVKQNSESVIVVEETEVIVVNSDISENTVLDSSMLSVKKVPTASVHANSVLKLDDAVGKMTSVKLFAGEVLLNNKLVNKEEENISYGLAYVIPDGYRAMSINVNVEEGVSGLLAIGNHVDILYHGTLEYHVVQSGQDAVVMVPFTKLLLQNVKILALDSIITGSANQGYSNITLQLTAEDSERLLHASKSGQIWLTLRPQGDDNWIDTSGVTLEQIIDLEPIIELAKKKYN